MWFVLLIPVLISNWLRAVFVALITGRSSLWRLLIPPRILGQILGQILWFPARLVPSLSVRCHLRGVFVRRVSPGSFATESVMSPTWYQSWRAGSELWSGRVWSGSWRRATCKSESKSASELTEELFSSSWRAIRLESDLKWEWFHGAVWRWLWAWLESEMEKWKVSVSGERVALRRVFDG